MTQNLKSWQLLLYFHTRNCWKLFIAALLYSQLLYYYWYLTSINVVSHLCREQFSRTLNPLQSWQNKETQSTLEVCCISFVHFFTKSLHFYGKFIANTTILDKNQPVFLRSDTSLISFSHCWKPSRCWGRISHDACSRERTNTSRSFGTFFWNYFSVDRSCVQASLDLFFRLISVKS